MNGASLTIRALSITLLGLGLSLSGAACGGGGTGGAGSGTGGSTQTTGGAGGGGTGGSTGECAGGEACVPAVPADWQGPVVVYSGDANATLPDCPTGFGTLSLDAYSGLAAAAPAECTCTCGEPTGGKCASPSLTTVQMLAHTAVDCGNSCGTPDGLFADQCIPVIQGSCGGVPKSVLSQSVTVSPPDLANAACEPALDKIIPEAPAFGAHVRVCAASGSAACMDGLCAATDHGAFGAAVCVVHAGDVPCPDSMYSNRTVVHETIADSRDCAPCACGGVTGRKCEGTMTAHSAPGCGSSLGSFPVPGCVPWLPTPSTSYIKFNLSATGGSCAPSGGEPTGDVLPDGPTTICCAN